MDAGLRVAHLAAVGIWAGALLALIFRLWRRARRGDGEARRERVVYRFLVMPGFFATALTGIWAFHREPALLREVSTHVKLGAVALLMVVDHLTRWGIEVDGGERRWAVLGGLTVVLVGVAAWP